MMRLRSRAGLTLVELLMFTAILALSAGGMIAFFMLTTESRVRQQVASDVEQNVIQMHQFLANEIRHAERVIAPARGQSGSVLTLQMSSQDGSPMIMSVNSGVLLLVRRDAEYILSPLDVKVSGFRVFNASPNDADGNVYFRFTVSRAIPTLPAQTYARTVEGAVTLFADDVVTGNACGCGSPRCDGGYYEWEFCDVGTCAAMSGTVLCPQ